MTQRVQPFPVFTKGIKDLRVHPVLNDDMAKRGKRVSFGKPEHFERHLTDEPFRHGTGEIGKVGLRHLIIEGLVGDGGAKEGIEAAVQIGDGLDTLAGTGRRQRQAQAKGRDDALASTKLPVFATGIPQRFGKHPLELVSDHAQLSVIHRGLLSSYQNNTHKRSFRWIAIKINNGIKYLKVPTYEAPILFGIT